MIFCATIVSVCLLGVASAQTEIKVDTCLTKENNLQVLCTVDSMIKKCTCISDGKVVASSDSQVPQDSTYKNRATIVIKEKSCNMTLKGFSSDRPQIFNCTINDVKSGTTTADKGKLLQCSACDILRHYSVTLLLTVLAVHLMSKLL